LLAAVVYILVTAGGQVAIGRFLIAIGRSLIAIGRSLINCGARLLAIRTSLIAVRAVLVTVRGHLFKVRTRPLAFMFTCCHPVASLRRRATSRWSKAGYHSPTINVFPFASRPSRRRAQHQLSAGKPGAYRVKISRRDAKGPRSTHTSCPFVSDGIESGLRQAKDAARGRDVALAGGASVVNQYLAAALVNEIDVSIARLILGAGERLFAGLDRGTLKLKQIWTVDAHGVTHIKYEVG
jgi:hypothetical protein